MSSNTIYDQLETIEYNEPYIRRYKNFMELCIEMNKTLAEDDYVERHHILPQSLFPTFSKTPENIIKLTARQHFIAHMILHKAYGGAMSQAFYAMIHMENQYHNRYVRVSSKQYEEIKNKVIEQKRQWIYTSSIYGKSGKDAPWWGKKHSEETKKLMSFRSKGRKMPENAKKKII